MLARIEPEQHPLTAAAAAGAGLLVLCNRGAIQADELSPELILTLLSCVLEAVGCCWVVYLHQHLESMQHAAQLCMLSACTSSLQKRGADEKRQCIEMPLLISLHPTVTGCWS